MHLTDPDQAVDFVEQTGVDALAVAIGTSHGAYKFTQKPTGEVLAMHLIEEIHQKLPDTHMVMHGSSSVPQELVDRINAAGGKLESTFGVPVEEIQQGIRHGVRKINVDTDGRLAITAALREALNAGPSEFDPRAFFKPAREAQKQVVVDRLTQFGAAGHAGDYEVLSLDEMKSVRGARSVPEPASVPEHGTIDQLCINTVRTLTVDAVQAAQSGHPGAPLALAPAAYVLYTRVMKHNPADPTWPDRDRFVLSAGHASMLLYASLHLSGYDAAASSEIKQFRQLGSHTPGHPENFETPGVETTTGPLGQGFGNARRDGDGREVPPRAASAREVCDHHIFAICSDGDLMEGVASEAASLAGHLRLGRLVFLYDDNKITIDGPTDLSFSTEDVDEALPRRTAGTRSRSTTATTSTRSRRRSAPAWPRRSARR